MSYTKQTFHNLFNNGFIPIFNKSLEDNDLTQLLDNLNLLLEVEDQFTTEYENLKSVWNEIISDTISSIFAALTGKYRLAMSGLRNILELSCSVYFYMDHEIEFKLYRDEDYKADKYVNSLISDFDFFKTKYIRTFYKEISTFEKSNDCCSNYLSLTYGKLCDVVHGRYKTLTKINSLDFMYNKELFCKYEALLKYTLGAIILMHALKFDSINKPEFSELLKLTNTLKLTPDL
jgi:hypothetical protein